MNLIECFQSRREKVNEFGCHEAKIEESEKAGKFHRSGPAIICSFCTITEHGSYPSKKVPNQAKILQDFIKMVSITLERLWMVSDRIVDFRFFVKFHRSGPAIICSF